MREKENQLNAIAADMDEIRASLFKLKEEIATFRKLLDSYFKQEHVPAIPPILPIQANESSKKTSIVGDNRLESLEEIIEELNNEVLMRTATISGTLLKMQQTMSNLFHCIQIIDAVLNKWEKRDLLYNERIQSATDYIKANPTPIVELTQWQRVGLAAKSWFNMAFLTDFRVLVFLFYLIFATGMAISYGVMYTKVSKQNAALEYYIERNLNIPRRK